ncbi:MAG: HD domain-containing protein [Azonexus sp.]|nr:HD domain-containing protein [Azonexus sp.]
MDFRSVFSPTIHDRDAFEDFADALIDRAPVIERDVARLKKQPQDRELTADLFRAIHNVKGDASLCKFELGIALVHPIESMMSRFRDGEIAFSDLLAELILLAIDRLELATEAVLHGKSVDHLQLPTLVGGLEKLAHGQAEDVDVQCAKLIEAVTGFPPVVTDLSAKATSSSTSSSDPKSVNEDLQFFRSLAMQFESRSALFKGRTMRILRLAQETNKIAGNPVKPVQLEAAVYLHDVGMMLLPETNWLKVGKMTDTDKQLLRNHPGYAAGLLQRMPGWDAAAQMVAQHHEMPNGDGYPNSLLAVDICAGAKILAIVDAFEAVMFKHIHRGKNRSVLRAIAEINACDTQFAPEWIRPFNQVIRKTLES